MQPNRREFLGAMGTGLVLRDFASRDIISVSASRTLTFGEIKSVCAIGWGGIRVVKREGDGATPAGRYPLRRLLFRPDRLRRPETDLPVSAISRRDGWCSEPNDPAYNRQITLPRGGRYENLWRDDGLYDLIVVIGHNDDPTVPGNGSAIFLHVSRPAMSRTDGCVAIPLDVLKRVVRRCDTNTVMDIATAADSPFGAAPTGP